MSKDLPQHTNQQGPSQPSSPVRKTSSLRPTMSAAHSFGESALQLSGGGGPGSGSGSGGSGDSTSRHSSAMRPWEANQHQQQRSDWTGQGGGGGNNHTQPSTSASATQSPKSPLLDQTLSPFSTHEQPLFAPTSGGRYQEHDGSHPSQDELAWRHRQQQQQQQQQHYSSGMPPSSSHGADGGRGDNYEHLYQSQPGTSSSSFYPAHQARSQGDSYGQDSGRLSAQYGAGSASFLNRPPSVSKVMRDQQQQQQRNGGGQGGGGAPRRMFPPGALDKPLGSGASDRGGNGAGDEEINTIFVVGFPDDITEREFVNMFAFATGFEAAMLKAPHSHSPWRERETMEALQALSSRLTLPMQLQQHVAVKHNDPYALMSELQTLQQQYDAGGLGALRSPPSSASQSLSALPSPPSIAQHSDSLQLQQMFPMSFDQRGAASVGDFGDPSNMDRSMMGGGGGDGGPRSRRQTIGFARFKSRTDALLARDTLQGRKLDPTSGTTLKVEMAKKNLHAKRGTTSTSLIGFGSASSDDLIGILIRAGRLTGPSGSSVGTPVTAMTSGTNTPSGTVGRNGGGPMMMGPPSSASFPPLSQHMAHPGPPDHPAMMYAAHHYQSYPAYEPEQHVNAASSVANLAQSPLMSNLDFASPFQGRPDLPDTATLARSAPGSHRQDSKALLALAEETDEADAWNVGGMDSLGPFDGESRGGSPQHNQQQQQQYGQQQAPVRDIGFGVSPQDGNESVRSGSSERSRASFSNRSSFGIATGGRPSLDLGFTTLNLGDQNPPINTLYVGNLPSAISSAYPPNHLEDCLRNLFTRSNGFKRMSFRQKVNGPMCFVEYEDVPHAAKAIQELYGHTLNGLIKGGLRLSYSKNNLGQRSSSNSIGQANAPNPAAYGVYGSSNSSSAGWASPSGALAMSPASPVVASLPFVPGLRPEPTIAYHPGGMGGYSAPMETPLSPLAQPFSSSFTYSRMEDAAKWHAHQAQQAQSGAEPH